jgi:S-adenosylmethionine:tRNA ribosyltransferase-isomerase
VAFEPPSAGYLLDWKLLAQMRAAGARFATLTHAAGISSTGDARLDARLPLDEPYNIPAATVQAIAQTRSAGGRIIAIGTTVVRALEHAAESLGCVSGAIDGIATQRIGPATKLRVVDAILSGTHEPETSHFELLQAFAGREQLLRVSRLLDACAYRTHEFGDSVLIEAALGRGPALKRRLGESAALSAEPC